VPIRIPAEVICNRCGAKASCVLDADELRSTKFWCVGNAIRHLPGWYYKDQHTDVACSEECMKILAEDKRFVGRWNPCPK
jgi:hypothetical protein